MYQPEIESLRFIKLCGNCPVGNVTGAEVNSFDKAARKRHVPQKVLRSYSDTLGINLETNAVAGDIDCRNIPKELPPEPQPMPAFGTAEREEYMRACPAYVALQSMMAPEE